MRQNRFLFCLYRINLLALYLNQNKKTMENLNENQGRSDEQYIQDAKAASLGCSLIVIGIIVLAFYGLVKLIF